MGGIHIASSYVTRVSVGWVKRLQVQSVCAQLERRELTRRLLPAHHFITHPIFDPAAFVCYILRLIQTVKL